MRSKAIHVHGRLEQAGTDCDEMSANEIAGRMLTEKLRKPVDPDDVPAILPVFEESEHGGDDE